MKYFRVTTDDAAYLVTAKSENEASSMIVKRYFYTYLDDMLSDAFNIEEIELPNNLILKLADPEALDSIPYK